MPLLRPPYDARWYRFPAGKPPPEIDLDYRGKVKAVYPVYTFTPEQCRSYVIQPHRGHYGAPFTLKTRPGVLFRGHRMTADRWQACWETWSCTTPRYAVEHVRRWPKRQEDFYWVATLQGYGDWAVLTDAKTHTYDRALIKTSKPKLKMQGPHTVCGEGFKIVAVERISDDYGIQTIWIGTRPRRLIPSPPQFLSKIGAVEWRKAARKRPRFRYCWLAMRPWRPDRRRFQAWKRARTVHRTTRIIPGTAGFGRFFLRN